MSVFSSRTWHSKFQLFSVDLNTVACKHWYYIEIKEKCKLINTAVYEFSSNGVIKIPNNFKVLSFFFQAESKPELMNNMLMNNIQNWSDQGFFRNSSVSYTIWQWPLQTHYQRLQSACRQHIPQTLSLWVVIHFWYHSYKNVEIVLSYNTGH